MIDKLKELGISATLVAVIGGIMAFVLGMALGVIPDIGFNTAVVGIILVVLLMLVASTTEVEKLDVFELVILFVMVGVIGSVVTTLLPAAAPYIITLQGGWSALTLGWSLVYVGAAFYVRKKVM